MKDLYKNIWTSFIYAAALMFTLIISGVEVDILLGGDFININKVERASLLSSFAFFAVIISILLIILHKSKKGLNNE